MWSQVLSRVKKQPDAGGKPQSVARAKLSHEGNPLKRGKSISWHGIAEGDELMLHLGGLEGDVVSEGGRRGASAVKASIERSKALASGSAKAAGNAVAAARAASSAAVSKAAAATAAANKGSTRSGSALSFLPTSSRAASASSKQWSHAPATNTSIERLAGKREELRPAVDEDVRAAADIVYDAVAREVKSLHKQNRRLRDQLRERDRLYAGDDSDEDSNEYDSYDTDEFSEDDDDMYGDGRRRRRRHSQSGGAGGGRSTSRDRALPRGKRGGKGGGKSGGAARNVPQAAREAFAVFDPSDTGFISNRESRLLSPPLASSRLLSPPLASSHFLLPPLTSPLLFSLLSFPHLPLVSPPPLLSAHR